MIKTPESTEYEKNKIRKALDKNFQKMNNLLKDKSSIEKSKATIDGYKKLKKIKEEYVKAYQESETLLEELKVLINE